MDIEHNACMAHIVATCGRLFGRQIKKVGGNPWKAIKKMQASRRNSSKYTRHLDSMLKSEIGQRMLRPDSRMTAWQPERVAIAVCTRWLSHFKMAYAFRVFREVDAQYSRAYNVESLDASYYVFVDFVLLFLKTMHDGILMLERDSRAVIFNAMAVVLPRIPRQSAGAYSCSSTVE
jgi:hypothetical protein